MSHSKTTSVENYNVWDNIDYIRCTCESCPSQYEGHLIDGRYIYIRYRWGILSVDVTDCIADELMGFPHTTVYIQRVESSKHSEMSLDDVKAHIGNLNIKPLAK